MSPAAVIREDPAVAARAWLAARHATVIMADPVAAARRWVEDQHPRVPGGRHGGEFTSAPGTGKVDDPKGFLAKYYGAWRDKLPPAQDRAMRFYQSPGFALMNGQLRGLDPEALKRSEHATDQDLARARKASKDLTAAIRSAPPLPRDITGWRGFDANQFGPLHEGQVITDPAFQSVALTNDAAAVGRAGKGVTAEVRLPKGTRAAGGTMRELVLAPGTSLRVTSVKPLRLEVAEPSGQLTNDEVALRDALIRARDAEEAWTKAQLRARRSSPQYKRAAAERRAASQALLAIKQRMSPAELTRAYARIDQPQASAVIRADPQAAARKWLESLHPREPGGKRGGQFIKKMKEFLDSPLEENVGGGPLPAPLEDPALRKEREHEAALAKLSPGARAIYDARVKRGFEPPVALKLAQNWEDEQKPKPPPAKPARTIPPGVPEPPPEEQELSGQALWASGEGVTAPTPAETAAVSDIWYSTSYTGTNAQLRAGHAEEFPGSPFNSDVHAFQGLIGRSPAFTRWARMYRGAGHGIHEFGPPGTAAGKILTDRGFVSVSSDIITAEDYAQGAIVHVHLPPGSHAYHADEVTWEAAGNSKTTYPLDSVQEYTLPPGCRFAVISDTPSPGPGVPRTLEVVVLPPGPAAAAAARIVLVAAAKPGLPGGQRFGWLPGELETEGEPGLGAAALDAAWEGPHPQAGAGDRVIVPLAAWDPAKHPRGYHGRFGTGTGLSAEKLMLRPEGRFTMAGLPDDDPLRAELDKRLTAPQAGRGPNKGQVTRPAVPPYAEAVRQVSDHITALIDQHHTMPDGLAWYPAEHAQAEKRSKRFGVPVEVAAGVESATSPRTHYKLNQQVTEELLNAVPPLKAQGLTEEQARERVGGGGIMKKFRDDGIAIAYGDDISKILTGGKRRSFYSNIMWPGQTSAVTVDTWMVNALEALGLTEGQAQHLAAERPAHFREGIGRMLVADAVRDAAARLGTSPDAVQAAYWIAGQQSEGFTRPGGRGTWTPAAAAADSVAAAEDMSDDEYDAALLLEYLAWRAKDIPGRIDLGPPAEAAGNEAAWTIVQASPKWKALGLTLAQAKSIAGGEGTGPQASVAVIIADTRAAKWDESKHPRGHGGKFAPVPGGGAAPKRSFGKLDPLIRQAHIRKGDAGPVTSADIEFAREHALGSGGDALHRALLKAQMALTAGDRKAAIGHLMVAIAHAKDRDDKYTAELYEGMAASLTSPGEQGFGGPLADQVKLGGDPAYWHEIGQALDHIPPDMQAKMDPVIKEVRLTDWLDPLEFGVPSDFHISGLWMQPASGGPDPGVLKIVTEDGGDHVALHEGMHAYDDAAGGPSNTAQWQSVAEVVRQQMDGALGSEYQAGFRGPRIAGNELWAEMAAQVLEGKPHLDVNPWRKQEGGGSGVLPPDLEALVRKTLAELGVHARA